MAEILEKELSDYGLNVAPKVRDRLAAYVRGLEHWNRTVNLTSLHGAELMRRLIVEPAWIGQELQVSGRLADIGSGNGSPGVPLYITRNLTRVHLVEARARRAAFLRHIANQLDGREIVVHRTRVEDMAPPLEPVEWITLQAVSPSATLLGALRRLYDPTTRVVWITGRTAAPTPRATRVCVPGSNTEVWIFQLDQF